MNWTSVSDKEKEDITTQEWAQVLTILLGLSVKLNSFGLSDNVSAFSKNVCILLHLPKDKEDIVVTRVTSLPVPSSKEVKFVLHHGKYFQYKPKKGANDK